MRHEQGDSQSAMTLNWEFHKFGGLEAWLRPGNWGVRGNGRSTFQIGSRCNIRGRKAKKNRHVGKKDGRWKLVCLRQEEQVEGSGR